MNRILVATDLSHQDEKLVNRAVQLALATGAKLHITHVYHELRIPGVLDNSQKNCGNYRRKIDDLIKEHPSDDGVDYTIHLIDGGRVYDQINKCAQGISADLIIAGVSKTSIHTPDFVLSTLEKLLVEASYPVLVVTQEAEDDYSNIAVFTPYVSSVLETVNILAPLTKNSGLAIHSFIDKPIKGTGFWARLQQKQRKRKAEKLHRGIASLLGKPFSFVRHEQDTLSALLKTALDLKVDVLAIETLCGRTSLPPPHHVSCSP